MWASRGYWRQMPVDPSPPHTGQPVAVWRREKNLRTLASLNRTVVEPTANGAVAPAEGVAAPGSLDGGAF